MYHLLTRRIQRDLLLVQALLSPPGSSNKGGKEESTDVRVYPAVVKLLDTMLQSLEQMRTLTVVDDSPDLATVVESRISYTKARRGFYLSRCYTPLKKYAEALTLLQHSSIHIRETQSLLAQLAGASPSLEESRLPSLNQNVIGELEPAIVAETLKVKRSWFTYNGGSSTLAATEYKKPLFFDIALNYVELDTDKLMDRAGKTKPPAEAPKKEASVKQTSPQIPTTKPGKVMEDVRPSTPVSSASQSQRGGLSSLLGGWWSRS